MIVPVVQVTVPSTRAPSRWLAPTCLDWMEMAMGSAANRSAPSSVRLLIICVLLGGSCTPQTQRSESQEPTSNPSLTPSPAPSLTPLPLEEARLDGEWMVRLFVRGSNFQSRPEKLQRGWIFTPRCEEGACDVILEGRVRFARDPERRLAGAEERFRVRLSRLGRSYGGLVNGFFASCETPSHPARPSQPEIGGRSMSRWRTLTMWMVHGRRLAGPGAGPGRRHS